MNQQVNPLKQLGILHKAMLAGQAFFAGITVFIFSQNFETPQMKDYDKMFQIIAVIMAATGFIIGTTLFKRKIREARESSKTASEKFAMYKSASIMLWAMLEAPCLVCIIFFYLTANYAFIILAAALIFLFFIFGPSREKVKIYLAVTESDIDGLK